RWARTHAATDIGVQFDMDSEWATYRWRALYVHQPGSGLLDPAGYLPNSPDYIVKHANPEEIDSECRGQIESARQAGIPLSHLDSHGDIVLYRPWLFSEYWKLGADALLPPVISKEYVLERGTPTDKPNLFHVGGVEIDIDTIAFDRILQMKPGFASKDWLKAYENALQALPPGVYLLRVHLGYNDEEMQAMTVDHPNWGAQWRQNDFDVISNPDFHKFLIDHGFTLVGWKDLPRYGRSGMIHTSRGLGSS